MLQKKIFSLPIILLIMVSVTSVAMIGYMLWRENRYATVIKAVSFKMRLDPLLVKAVIKRESNFNPRACGKKGEIGLMQVTPAACREYASSEEGKNFSPDDLFDPALNIQAGCWYLAKAMHRYNDYPNPVPFALAHYNAGATNVDRWLNTTKQKGNVKEFMAAITYPGTRNYINYITGWLRWYRIFSL